MESRKSFFMEDFRLDFKKMKNFTEKRRMRKRDTPGRVSIPIHYQKMTLLLCTLEDRYADAVGALSPVFFFIQLPAFWASGGF